MSQKLQFNIFILLLVILPSYAQLSESQIDKIDPRMYTIVQEELDQFSNKSKNFLTSTTTEGNFTLNSNGEKEYGVVIRSKDPSTLRANGIPVNSIYENFATARLTVRQIIASIQLIDVEYITLGEIYYPTNDVANGLVGSDLIHNAYINGTAYKGSGVIVCIVDTGIDWEHLDFRDPSNPTQSRILYIWDQTLTDDGDEDTPFDRGGADFAGLTYGVEYTNAHIEDEIDGSPAGYVREEDTNGHGTHVAGTAAGNGAAQTNQKYAGIAPEADILVVKAGNGSFPTTNTVDALTYAHEIANDEVKPVVVNMSLGGHANPHDGTSTLSQTVDAFVGSAGRVAVISAGNEGGDNIHITGTLPGSGSSTIQFTVPAYTPNGGADNDYFGFDLWFDDGTDATATVTSPAPNSISYSRNDGESGTGATDTDGSIYLYNDVNGTNSDREIYVYVDDNDAAKTPISGAWELEITNNTATPVTYHGWLFGSRLGSSEATLLSGDTDYTVGSPGTADEAITIGSYVSRWRWKSTDGGNYSYTGTDYSDDISSFSSIGPTRDSRQKPELVGPGQAIVSSLSADIASPTTSSVVPGGTHIKNQGTSMSSPVVAGTVALLLNEDNTLTGAAVKTLLTANTDTDTYTGGALPDFTWGYGKVNIFKTLSKSINASWTPDQQIIAYDQWGSEGGLAFDPNDLISVEFSPSISGSVTGVFFHTSTTNTLTSDVSVEVWSDDGGGQPDTKLGSTVMFDKDDILLYSWNYLDMTGAGVTVSSGTDYHIVLYYTSGTNGTNDFALRLETTSVDGRTNFSNDGGTNWFTQAFDMRMRAIVSEESSNLPVELVSFNASVVENSVSLDWETATEINNYGFDIERRIEDDEKNNGWLKIGFVKGNGTSASPKYYTFVDENPPVKKLEYRLKQIDLDGNFEYYNQVAKVDATVITSIEEEIPTEFALHQNFPNPFNPSTKIKFDLPQKSNISISIFNILGEKVTTITSGIFDAGYYEVNFNATNLTSNIYFYRFESDSYAATKKMIVLK